jgi:protein associated with RNAse G/E
MANPIIIRKNIGCWHYQIWSYLNDRGKTQITRKLQQKYPHRSQKYILFCLIMRNLPIMISLNSRLLVFSIRSISLNSISLSISILSNNITHRLSNSNFQDNSKVYKPMPRDLNRNLRHLYNPRTLWVI